MSYAQSVTIGPEFFAKAFNDYSNKFWAFARELLQNSIDARSSRIDVRVVEDPGEDETRVEVVNDGEPMTEDVLVDKLLSLGSSGKGFQNAVGGFGKAKEILYFAHKRYTIVSGDWCVRGSGAGYDITPNTPHFRGAASDVVWKGQAAESLRGMFRRFIELTDPARKVRFTLDGEPVRSKLPTGTPARELEQGGETWAIVRTSRAEENLLVVRTGGIPMFTQRCDYKGTITLDLTDTSARRLTSNRDALRFPFSDQFREFVTQIAVDRKTALKREVAEYTRHAGPKLRRPSESDPVALENLEAAIVDWVTAARSDVGEAQGGGGIAVAVKSEVEAPAGVLGHEFVVKNCVRRRVPKEFDPDDPAFSNHARWLVKAWSGCLIELHALTRVDDLFTVGFVFSEGVEAEYEENPKYGKVYYINPCVVAKKSTTRRFKKTNRGRIAATAAHEFVHGGLRESYHGEDFAAKQTDLMGTVCDHWRRFTRHFN